MPNNKVIATTPETIRRDGKKLLVILRELTKVSELYKQCSAFQKSAQNKQKKQKKELDVCEQQLRRLFNTYVKVLDHECTVTQGLDKMCCRRLEQANKVLKNNDINEVRELWDSWMKPKTKKK